MEPTGAAPLRPTDLREIGPYRLLGRLGEGGMGTVFLARAPTGRFVAVKVVKAEFANQEGFAARFHGEVENARRVASFCTAQVLDNGNTGDGRPYMVTEYIAGTPLSDQISAYGALDPGPLHGVALGVAAALAAIHVAGLVHRDLKPANVILSLSGPRVIDFGIARALDRETGFTMSGELLGSPGWWAPEQVKGHPVTPAVDIFAWGCLVAYAGNGRHPFGRGDPITLATRVLHTQPELGALPAPLDELVRRATAMEPEHRPAAQELLIALVGGSAPGPSVNPPTLVAPDLMAEWEPPRNVVDEPDITATFATPPPSDTMVDRDPSGKGRAGPTPARGRKGPPLSSPEAAPDSGSEGGPGSGGGAKPGSGSAARDEASPSTSGYGPSGEGSAPGGPPRERATQGQAGGPGRSGDQDVSVDAVASVSDPAGAAPGQGVAGPSGSEPVSVTELARREELAAREELARWRPTALPDHGTPTSPPEYGTSAFPPGHGTPTSPHEHGTSAFPPGHGTPTSPTGQGTPTFLPGQRTSAAPPPGGPPAGPGYERPRSTRWLIAAAAALLAVAVTGAVLIVTSGRDTTTTGATASPTAQPNDVGRRFTLGKVFDDPAVIVPEAPRCGLPEYEGTTQTQGQLCVLRWVMLNPGGKLREIGDPVVSLRDDRGGRHDPVGGGLDVAAIAPGDRIDGVFVFDLPPYRKPVELSATMLKDGEQIEVKL